MNHSYKALYASLFLMGFASESLAQTEVIQTDSVLTDTVLTNTAGEMQAQASDNTEQNFVRLQDVFITVERKKNAW